MLWEIHALLPLRTHPVLPIDAILPALLASLATSPSVVLEAPPGAGKTTRVPPALLPHVPGEIIVLEPRRIAARLAAHRVADEHGEPIGETIGYQVRFEEKSGPRTRLRFVTEGILTRRLISDPQLRGVSAVVLDEFHERHLDGDLALALLKHLQQTTRRDLRLIVMSATLEADPVARFLGNCPVLRSQGRLFPIDVRHAPYSPDPLSEQVRRAVDSLTDERRSGHMLVFLPGLAEIRRAMSACGDLAQRNGLTLLPLHGDLSPAEQDRAVNPGAPGERKVIFSTNVAETSVTVEGVNAVIDTGLARMVSVSAWNGLPSLRVGRISKASATQRAGRAGRTSPGVVLRLYPEADFSLRPDHDTPEILRADLTQLLLTLRASGVAHPGDLHWLDAPPEAAVAAAETLLSRLGAAGDRAAQLARLPVAPRLAALVLAAEARGVGEDGCRAAALLGAGIRPQSTDLLAALDEPADSRVRQHLTQLRRAARPRPQSAPNDDALLMAVLAAFPDRVARRRSGAQVLLSNGNSAEIAANDGPRSTRNAAASHPTAPAYEFMVALEAETRDDKPLPLIRLTARIEPEWLLDLFPDRIADTSATVWNRSAERAEQVNTLRYDALVLDETRGPAPPAAAAALLAEKALDGGLDGLASFADRDALVNLLARLHFAGLATPGNDTPDLTAAVTAFCAQNDLRSFADLRSAGPALLASLEAAAGARQLAQLAPATVRLPSGRHTPVHYDEGKPPWIASRLQDFFGVRETPRVGRERTPLVVHLLAPNHRALQTTTDLAGFWQRLYPQVRKELMRRYPRHSWPEDPLTAEPTARPLPRK